MKTQRIGVVLTVLNLVILVTVLAQNRPSEAQGTAPVLRGRALEIIDEQGLVRASIKVHGPETKNGKEYPGAVVLVMGHPKGAPGVKLAASEKGSGLGLSNGHRLPDGRSAGIQLHADDPVVVLIDSQGRERVLKP